MAYRFNNGPIVTQTYTGAAIQPGQQVLFSFLQQFVPGSNEAGSICAWSDWAPDETTGNDTTCVQVNVSVGMNERSLIEASTWPNPANSGIFVDGLPAGVWTVRLIDAQGRLVLNEQRTAAGARCRWNLVVQAVANGAYSLHALSERGAVPEREWWCSIEGERCLMCVVRKCRTCYFRSSPSISGSWQYPTPVRRR